MTFLPPKTRASVIGPTGQFSQFERVFQSLPQWTWETDSDYRLTYLSGNAEQTTKVASAELLGVDIMRRNGDIYENEAGLDAYYNALANKERIESFAYERRMVSGKNAVFIDSAEPMFDHHGAFLGYRGISFHFSKALALTNEASFLVGDLQTRANALETALVQRNEELAHTNGTLTEILNAMGEGLVVTTGENIDDPENRILFVNPAFLEQFDLPADRVHSGQPFFKIVECLAARGDAPQGLPNSIGATIFKEGGAYFPLKSVQRTIKASGSARPNGGYVLVHSDVTEIENRTMALEKARQDADVANAAKSNFLAAMSHEIRTPMNGIVGMADLLATTNVSDEQAEYIDTIRSSALALTSLISSILDFSKVEAGHVDLFYEPFKLPDLLRDVTALMRALSEAKGLDLRVELQAGMPEVYIGDDARLRQILLNLLGNAIKFTQEGSVVLRATGGDPLILEVSDTGMGIPADKIGRVFDPFEQAQGGMQRQFEGTGLGLAITKRLVGEMQGNISVSSEVGKGTSFVMSLPLAPTTERPKEAPQETKPRTQEDVSQNLHILVAEDNRTNQLVVRKMLERVGAAHTIVANGLEAVGAFERERFDAVLMDISMPKMSGLQATREIRAFEAREGRERTPIIALTGNAFEKDRDDALASGMDDFMSKPVRMEALHLCLARHCQRSDAPDLENLNENRA